MIAFRGVEIMNHSIVVQEMTPFVERGRVIVTILGDAAVHKISSIHMIIGTSSRNKFHLTTLGSL